MADRIVYTKIPATRIHSGNIVTAPGHNLKPGDTVRVTDHSGTFNEGDYTLNLSVYPADDPGGNPFQPYSTDIINDDQFTLQGLANTGVDTNTTQYGMSTIELVAVGTATNSLGEKIKIGFDKVPAPVTKQFQQLVDNEGTLLFDDAGNPLFTEESAALTSLTLASNALPIYVNNKNEPGGGGSIAIEERFKEFSEVSSSLLGVPRAEEQLSLFSDVATYGLDNDNWDASDFSFSHNNDPYEWYHKEHPVHGRRSNVEFYEGSDEQALYLKAFPSQYSFPYGTRYKKRTRPEDRFKKYLNFIALGRYLHDFFSAVGVVNDANFADANFLSGDLVEIVKLDGSLLNATEDVVAVSPRYNFPKQSISGRLSFENAGDFIDVEYLGEKQQVFDAIERFTSWYDKIRQGSDAYPKIISEGLISAEGQSRFIDITQRSGYKAFREYDLIRNMIIGEEALPGDSATESYYGVLQSKRTFRYQPGRVSGFTFGVRMASDNALVSSTVAEWGCANDTDEYMFQLKGENLSIIRRSSIELPSTWFERENISPSEQRLVPVMGVRNNQEAGSLHETRIRREDFNGDALNGGGESGYNLKFEDVTMYKIEFSWYGAIGAKFYAYVPVGNSDCRWVLMHTFVIENALGQPVLENPDFRMKYLLHTNNTKEIRSPIYLYKYGSSVYVDGGDEGTIRLSSDTVDSKNFNNRTPILGIMPRESIKNSEGTPKVNFKKIYPTTLTVTSDKTARIDFEEIKGSSQGMHFTYAPSLYMNGRHPKTRILSFQYRQFEEGATNISILPSDNVSTDNINRVLDANGDHITSDNKYSVNHTQNSATIILDTTDPSTASTFNTLQVGDKILIDSDDIPGDNSRIVKHFLDSNNQPIYDSTGTDALVLESTIPVSGTSYVDVSYEFNADEKNAHLIADGVYGTYLGGAGGSTIFKRGRKSLGQTPYSLIESTGTNSLRNDGSILNASDVGTIFTGALSSYRTIVSSDIPITANKFKIHFLNPDYRDPGVVSGETHNSHWAEFGIGITPYAPKDTANRSDSDPELKFDNNGTFEEYNSEEFPFIDYVHASTNFDQIELLDGKEIDPLYGNRLQVDPRLNSVENRLEGINSGNVSTVSGEVGVLNLGFKSFSGNNLIYAESNAIRIDFDNDFTPPAPGTIIPFVSELGLDFIGTGTVFLSDFIDKRAIGEYDGEIAYCIYIQDSSNNRTTLASLQEKNIQLKTLTLKDDWRAYAVDESGAERFDHKRFNITQAVPFNIQPLYPVFAMGDFARINGIVIEEILEQGLIRSHTPNFVKETHNGHSLSIVTNETVGNESFSALLASQPSAFNTNSELDASRFDKVSNNQLRPGNLIYSTFIGEGETLTLELENIFARDRKGITRGSLNNKAVYITATSFDGFTGSMQLSVTNKEQ